MTFSRRGRTRRAHTAGVDEVECFAFWEADLRGEAGSPAPSFQSGALAALSTWPLIVALAISVLIILAALL